MFNRILIANRGEIACRIIKTIQNMGMKAIAVYSTADANSPHVQQADYACCIGEPLAKNSYLNIEAIIEAALLAKADAIHPGYGFLSENSQFAKACAKAGIIFIGPSVAAIEAMGSKLLAKQLLEKTSVPLTPGYHGKEQNDSHLLVQAKKLGFPILLKAANGGGGKGMRAVYEEIEFQAALDSARREAKACFSDDTMIIEKLIANPRHVEIQIMADNHGQVVHLFERDCSIQRRHQKIIEEAPAPNLSATLRTALAEAACNVAKAIEYRSAGTVEFLVDTQNDSFYFMEMNTRLQVEHPVTEMITGFDLVAWQIQIAANLPLPVKQENIQAKGHSIECRIYAEDPSNHFLPSIGVINFLREPQGDKVRIDSGVEELSTITQFYDPMIAKLITWGITRNEALTTMQKALTNYAIGGIKTNIPFLQAICKHAHFSQVQLSTDFLDKEIITLASPETNNALFMAVAYDYLNLIKNLIDPLAKKTFAWQMHQQSYWIWHYTIEDELFEIKISPIDDQSCTIHWHENTYNLKMYLKNDTLIIKNGMQHDQAIVDNQESNLTLYLEQGNIKVHRFNWQNSDNQITKKGQLTAPMPATIVAILKQEGDSVKTGEGLMVLEAMKMEHTIHSPREGIIKNVFYTVGAQVSEGAELLSLGD
jgi:3-methylcrotonyl-CoA carboxylase alpha subunit